MNWLRRLFAAEGGSIIVLAALSLTVVMGMSGIAVELGNGYATKVRNQRVADMAAIGAALAYKNGGQSTAAATQVAKDIVIANGLSASMATVTVPVTIGAASAVQVQVTTSVPIKMASLLTSNASYNVTNVAAASLTSSSGTSCITALSSSNSSVDLNGGAAIVASGCAITTNGTVTLSGGATINAKQVVATGTSANGGASFTTAPTANNILTKSNAASDTVMSTSAVQSALCYVNKINGTTDTDYTGGNTSCISPLVTPTKQSATVSTTDWNLTYQPRSASTLASYQTADNSCNYVIPAGTYVIRTLTVNGGCSVSFQNGSTLTVDDIDMSGSAMTIGNVNLTVTGTFKINSDITIGNGTHYFGALDVGGGRNVTIGSGNFTVYGAITEAGGSKLMVGTSTGDTVTIGTKIDIQGGSYLCFTANCGTPTAVAGTFSVGALGASKTDDITTAGGSTLILPIANTHVIKGDLSLSGSSTLGSGLYVIGGDFTNNTGGTMTGKDVTFALGGTFALSGGTTLDLAAPSNTSSYGITDILVATKSTAQTSIGGGSSDKYSGVLYAPKSDLKVSGGGSISTSGSSCLMVVVNTASLTGSGNLNTSACASQTSSAAGTVALLQ